MLKSVTFRSTLAAVAWAISFSVFAMANGPTQVDIPAGNLVPALEALEKQAAIELVFQPEQLKSFRTKGVKGTYEPKDAVQLLLKGTPLEVRTDPSGAMVIVPSHTAVTRSQSQAPGDDGKGDNSRSGLQLPQATPGTSGGIASLEGQQRSKSQQSSETVVLQEVIVTAQKRSERLQDVPVPVSSVSADSLVSAHQFTIQTYYTQVPGLSFTPGPYGEPYVAIRGITTGALAGNGNPTVAATINDVPFGSALGIADATAIPDIDPSDLGHIEVLRGPQGTLYGASSIGGLIKYVTIDPSTSGFAGQIEGSSDKIQNGSQLGYSFHAAVNVPAGDTFAVRASGYARQEPGYIDNLQTNESGVNRQHANGGLLSLLWGPSADVSLKVVALLQNSESPGSSYADPTLGDLVQSSQIGTGSLQRNVQSYSANLTAKLGNVTFTSLTGYGVNSLRNVFDYTPFFGANHSLFNQFKTKKFTQEFRLTGATDGKFDWLAGAYFTHENDPGQQTVSDIDPTTGYPIDTLIAVPGTTRYQEVAAFADVTVHFSQRFDVQFGARESHITNSVLQSLSGSLIGPVVNFPEISASGNAFTYLVTPQLKLSPDMMLYARLASGYRAGGPNANSAVGGFQSQYAPDKTNNYELGLKGDFLSHRLAVDTSLYYIDWKDIQLGVYKGVYGYVTNAGGAKSEGVELSLSARPFVGTTITSWIAWDNAKLTQAFPSSSPSVGAPGDKLPFSSPFSGNLSVEQEFLTGMKWSGYFVGAASYVDDRAGPFVGANAPRQMYPSYVQVDARLGVRGSSWDANLFATNLANRRGILSGDPVLTNHIYYIQPRTIGVSFSKQL